MIKKLCVASPNHGDIKTETVYSLIQVLFKTGMTLGCGLHIYFPAWSSLDDLRRKSAQEALDVGASHLMFIDSDMVFPDDGVLTLASRDKMIIGANYNLRKLPLLSTVKIADDDGNLIEVPGKGIPTQPFKCYAVATGFMLIKTEVFHILPKPWFLYGYDFEKNDTIGEDVYFCKHARANGIDVWCDPTVIVKHIGNYSY